MLADNGQVIVLGGLIQDDVTEQVQKVPLLGDIPIIGGLFRNTSTKIDKKHLLIFIRPTIVRDKRAMDHVTGEKYSLIRAQQLEEIEEGVSLIDDKALPLLPEWREQLEELRSIQNKEAEAAEK